MGFSGFISQLFRKFDLFATHQFIRYKGEPSFKTATGGLASIAIIAIIIIVSSNVGMKMLRKETVISSVSYQYQVDPSNLTITFEKDSSFMLAATIYNQTSGESYNNYFSVALVPYINGQLEPIYYVPCTSDHFSHNSETLFIFDRMQLNKSLCPPLGASVVVGGRGSSQVFSMFTVQVTKCNPLANSNCVSDQIFNKVISDKNALIKFQMPYINTVINSAQQTYKQVYVEDQNQFYFCINNGIIVQASISGLVTNTDLTIWPYSQIKTEVDASITNPATFFFLPSVSNPDPNIFVYAYFAKSSQVPIYTRRFTKLDDYFSYVGGLISTIVAVFFIMRSYSQNAYLISIAEKIFNYDGHSDINSKGFNIYYFAKMAVKKVLNALHFNCHWAKTDMFIRSSMEMAQQLNIQLLLERLSFLEEGIFSLLDQHQIQALYLKDKRPILKAEFTRKKHLESRNIIADLLEKMKIGIPLQSPQQLMPNQSQQVIAYQEGTNYLKQNQRQIKNHNFREMPKIEQNPDPASARKSFNQQRTSVQSLDQIRQSLVKLIKEGGKGDPTSQKILGRANKKILQQIRFKNQIEQQKGLPRLEKMQSEISIDTSRQRQISISIEGYRE